MRYILPLSLVFAVGACTRSPEVGEVPGKAQPTPLPERQNVAPKNVQRLVPGNLDAKELADYLRHPSVWTFQYSGGRVRCWLEIDNNGEKTKWPPDGSRYPNKDNEKASEGKIVAWWRPGDPGELGVRMISGVVDSPGRMTMPKEGLWWGYKGSTEKLWVESNAVTPKPGTEVTLVRAEYVEAKVQAKDPQALRKVVILFKASFPDD